MAMFIIRQVAPLCQNTRFVIAGHSPNLGVLPHNVEIVANPSDTRLDELLCKAHINLMLKLLNTLVRSSGHIIANKDMLYGHQLGRFCTQADTPNQIAEAISRLMVTPIDKAMYDARCATIEHLKSDAQERLCLISDLQNQKKEREK